MQSIGRDPFIFLLPNKSNQDFCAGNENKVTNEFNYAKREIQSGILAPWRQMFHN